MAKKHDWIKGAIKHPGALTAEAKAKGESMDELCSQANLTGVTAKRCALRKTLMGMKK